MELEDVCIVKTISLTKSIKNYYYYSHYYGVLDITICGHFFMACLQKQRNSRQANTAGKHNSRRAEHVLHPVVFSLQKSYPVAQ